MAKKRSRVPVDRGKLVEFHNHVKRFGKTGAMERGEVREHQGIRFIRIHDWIIPLGQHIEPKRLKAEKTKMNFGSLKLKTKVTTERRGKNEVEMVEFELRDGKNIDGITFSKFQSNMLAMGSGAVGNWKGFLFVRTGESGFEYLHPYGNYRSLEDGHFPTTAPQA